MRKLLCGTRGEGERRARRENCKRLSPLSSPPRWAVACCLALLSGASTRSAGEETDRSSPSNPGMQNNAATPSLPSRGRHSRWTRCPRPSPSPLRPLPTSVFPLCCCPLRRPDVPTYRLLGGRGAELLFWVRCNEACEHLTKIQNPQDAPPSSQERCITLSFEIVGIFVLNLPVFTCLYHCVELCAIRSSSPRLSVDFHL